MQRSCLNGVLFVVGLWLSATPSGFSQKDDPKPKEEAPDKSIVLSTKRSVDNRVQNGSAFDKATLKIGDYKTIVIPEEAKLRQEGKGQEIQIYMEKTLAFGGHPPKTMNVVLTRKHMGCATKAAGDTLVLGTFGEWSSIEGGASMKLVVVVPEGVTVERREKLSGPKSSAQRTKHLKKEDWDKEGYWYGPVAPAEGWDLVPTMPDPEKQAAK